MTTQYHGAVSHLTQLMHFVQPRLVAFWTRVTLQIQLFYPICPRLSPVCPPHYIPCVWLHTPWGMHSDLDVLYKSSDIWEGHYTCALSGGMRPHDETTLILQVSVQYRTRVDV